MIELNRNGILVVMQDGKLYYFPDGNDGKGGEYREWVKNKNGLSFLTSIGNEVDDARKYNNLSSDGMTCPECLDHISDDVFLNPQKYPECWRKNGDEEDEDGDDE